MCKSLLPWFENEFRVSNPILSVPDEDPRVEPDSRIDLLAKYKQQSIAFEHTTIGPYVEYEYDQKQSKCVEKEVQIRLQDFALDCRFEICLPLKWHTTMNSRQKQRFYSELADELPKLNNLEQNGRQNFWETEKKNIQGVTVLFRYRRCRTSGHCVSVVLFTENENEMEVLRECRMAKLEKKVKKLSRWQATKCKTTLVLENRDDALSDSLSLRRVIKEVIQGFPSTPDFVFLVDSSFAKEWTVYPLRICSSWDVSLYATADQPKYWKVFKE